MPSPYDFLNLQDLSALTQDPNILPPQADNDPTPYLLRAPQDPVQTQSAWMRMMADKDAQAKSQTPQGTRGASPSANPSSGSSYGNSAVKAALTGDFENVMNQMMASNRKAHSDEEQGIQDQENYLNQLKSQKPQTDLTPLLQFVDAQTGSNYTQGYQKQRPMTDDERAKTVAALQNAINQRKGDLSKNDADMFRTALTASAMLNRGGGMEDIRAKQLELQQQKAAENKVNQDKYLNAYTQRMEGVNRIQDLMDKAAAGKVVPNAQIKGMIEEELARLEQNQQNLALGHVERQTMNAAQNKLAKALEFVSGNPQDSITMGQMKQLQGVIDTLAPVYKSQYENRFKFLTNSAQNDVEKRIYNQKYSDFNNLYGSRFKTQPASSGAHPQDSQAIQWAKSQLMNNPNDPTALQILKVNGVQ